mgnify:CR=1 FL=1
MVCTFESDQSRHTITYHNRDMLIDGKYKVFYQKTYNGKNKWRTSIYKNKLYTSKTVNYGPGEYFIYITNSYGLKDSGTCFDKEDNDMYEYGR